MTEQPELFGLPVVTDDRLSPGAVVATSASAACVICGAEVHTLPEVRACLKALGSVPERARPGG